MAAGISLAKKGQKCLMVSAGQSALHFFSGSIDAYGCKGSAVGSVSSLPSSHPYSKMGKDTLIELTPVAESLLADLGLDFVSNDPNNHSRRAYETYMAYP